MIAAVGNGQTDLVQPRRPLQGLRRVLIEPPRRGHLLQALLGGARHTLRLPAVHMVARRQTGNGTRTNILMTHAAEQVMKQPLAQRPVGHLQALDLQCFERGNQNRQTAGQHRGAVLADTEGLQVPDVTDAEQHLAQAIKRVERDVALAPAARLQHRTDGAHGPGSAIGGLPAKRAELRRHRLELEARRRFRAPHGLGRDLAFGKVTLAEPHTTDMQALHLQRLEPATDDRLGAAAADVEHQPLAIVVGQVTRHALINKTRLLLSGNNFNRAP